MEAGGLRRSEPHLFPAKGQPTDLSRLKSPVRKEGAGRSTNEADEEAGSCLSCCMLLVILFGPDLLPEASKHVPHTALLWSCLQAGEAKPVKGEARQARAEARKTGFGRGARQAFDPARCQRLSRHGPPRRRVAARAIQRQEPSAVPPLSPQQNPRPCHRSNNPLSLARSLVPLLSLLAAGQPFLSLALSLSNPRNRAALKDDLGLRARPPRPSIQGPSPRPISSPAVARRRSKSVSRRLTPPSQHPPVSPSSRRPRSPSSSARQRCPTRTPCPSTCGG